MSMSIRGRSNGSSTPGAASTRSGAASVSSCASSRSPSFGLSGTTGTPASSPATTPTAVWIVGVACTATREHPAICGTSAAAAPASSR